VKDPIFANARGAAFLAAIALKRITVDDIPDCIGIKAEYRPDPSNRKVYDELFADFLDLYRVHRKVCSRMNRRTAPNVCALPPGANDKNTEESVRWNTRR
jgi:xylulokinase